MTTVRVSFNPTERAIADGRWAHHQSPVFQEARKESSEIYCLRDFKLRADSPDSPHHNDYNRLKREPSARMTLSQSEHDWAFAKRALARGDDLEDVARKIAHHRANDKSNPEYYARLTVTKALAELRGSSPQSEERPDPKH